MDNNKISFTGDDGEIIEMFVIERTKFHGADYLLVTDSEDDEATAYIMKQKGDSSAKGEISYDFVEDGKEINAVAGIFEELLEGEVDLLPDDGE